MCKLILLVSNYKCQAWVYGEEKYRDSVMSPLNLYADYKKLTPSNNRENMMEIISGVQLAKLILIYESSLFEDMLEILRNTYGRRIPSTLGGSGLIEMNQPEHYSLTDFVCIELELYKLLTSGRATHRQVERLY